MRKVGIEIYNFDELSKDIQEKLIEKRQDDDYNFYCDFELEEDMENIAKNLLNEYFKGATFKQVFYDLSCRQGSGSMIEFTIYLEDINKKYKSLTKKEINKISNLGGTQINVYHNDNLYCHENSYDIECQDYTVYDNNLEKIQEKIDNMLENFKKDIYDMNCELTKQGYNLLDEVSTRETVIYSLREYEYFKDGTIFDNDFTRESE